MGSMKVWDGTSWQTASQQGPAGPLGAVAAHAPTHYTGASDPLTGRLPLNVDGTGSVVLGDTAALAGGATTAVGWHTLGSQTSSSHSNTGVGYNACGGITTGYSNAALGRGSGNVVTTGYQNVFVGQTANAFSVNQGNGNEGPASFNAVAVGFNATIYGQEAIAVGMGALAYNYGNVAVGANARAGTYPASGAAGWQSVAIGQSAVASGIYSIAHGSSATATRPGSVAIGRDSGGTAAAAAADNDFVLGTAAHNVRVAGQLLHGGVSLTHANWIDYTPIFASDQQPNGEGMTPGAGGFIFGSYAMIAPYTMALRFVFGWGSSGGNGGSGPLQFGLPPGYSAGGTGHTQMLHGSVYHPTGGTYVALGPVWAGSSRFYGTCHYAGLDGYNGVQNRLNTAANFPVSWYPNGSVNLAGIIQVAQRW